MKLSARNRLPGTVSAIDTGTVNSTVRIDLGGDATVTAMITNAAVEDITNAAVEDLGIEVGKTAYAIVKASDVIVGVD